MMQAALQIEQKLSLHKLVAIWFQLLLHPHKKAEGCCEKWWVKYGI